MENYEQSVNDIVKSAKASGLVLYGAGHWGGIAERVFKDFGVSTLAFCDRDPGKQGRFFRAGKVSDSGTPIVPLDEAISLYPGAVYIVTTMWGAGWNKPDESIILGLKERGLKTFDFASRFLKYIYILEGVMDEIEIPLEETENKFRTEHIDNMVILNHMSNSGSMLFCTLLNGHENILDISVLGAFVQLSDLCKHKFKHLSKKELVLEIADLLRDYLSTRYNISLLSKSHCNEHGEFEKRVLADPRKFTRELYALISECEHITCIFLLKAIYAAYANTIGKKREHGKEYWLLYDQHRAGFPSLSTWELERNFKKIEYIFIVREPVQHFFSALKRFIVDDYPGAKLRTYIGSPHGYLRLLTSDLGLPLEKSAETEGKGIKVVRFEDLKTNLEGTLRAVCGALDIPFDECLLETSVNGIPVYFPASWKPSETTVITAGDKTALNRRDFSSLMSSYDILRLNLAFRRFKLAMSYDCDVPDPSDFSIEFLRELYSYPFKFEETIDMAGNEALERGRLLPGEQVGCHDNIAELFIDNITRKDKPEFISEILRPTGN